MQGNIISGMDTIHKNGTSIEIERAEQQKSRAFARDFFSMFFGRGHYS
jgi:hypothetical protein